MTPDALLPWLRIGVGAVVLFLTILAALAALDIARMNARDDDTTET